MLEAYLQVVGYNSILATSAYTDSKFHIDSNLHKYVNPGLLENYFDTSDFDGSVPCLGHPEPGNKALLYKGEKFSSRDRFRPC